MKQQMKYGGDRQQGVALPIVMVILVLSAMIVLYMANTSKKEQQISADQYRTEQSLNAAMAGLDWAVDYYNANGLDANNDDVVDYAPPFDSSGDPSDTDAEPCESNCKANRGCPKRWCIGSDVSTDTAAIDASGDLIVKSRTFFCNTTDDKFWTDPENCDGLIYYPDLADPTITIKDNENVGIVSIGYSDDNTARRVVSVKVASSPPVPGDGVNTPFTTHGNAELLGTVDIINRYYDYNVWAGGTMNFHQSDAKSYIRDRNINLPHPPDRFDERNRQLMISPDKDKGVLEGALPASFATRGNNADVVDEDPILNTLITQAEATGEGKTVDCSVPRTDGKDYFFCAFFSVNRKEDIQESAAAIGQDFTGTDCGDIDGTTGVVYWEGGTCKLTKFDAGTFYEPALVFIDGDLFINGGTVYGMVYVTGTFEVAGNFIIYGSSLAEGGLDIHKGGTGKFIFDMFSVAPDEGFNGSRGIVPNTWRDWKLN